MSAVVSGLLLEIAGIVMIFLEIQIKRAKYHNIICKILFILLPLTLCAFVPFCLLSFLKMHFT